MVLKRNPDIIPDLGGGENYRVLKHGPNLLKRLCSLGGGRNYRVLKRTLSAYKALKVEEITGHSNPTLCLSILKQGLEEGKITGFSNQT